MQERWGPSLSRWRRASSPNPRSNRGEQGPGPAGSAAPQLLLLASRTAAADWLADSLTGHPHWQGTVHRLGQDLLPLSLDAEPQCRAVLVVRHPALEAIEARLSGRAAGGGEPGGGPQASVVDACRDWHRQLGPRLMVVPVASLIDGRHPSRLRRICRHLSLPFRGTPRSAAVPAPPAYDHGLPRAGGWHFNADGLRAGPSADPPLGGSHLVDLLEGAEVRLEQIIDAGLLPPAELARWRRISRALATYAVTTNRGRSSFWIGVNDDDAGLTAGVAGGRGGGGPERSLAARLGRSGRFSHFEPPLRLYGTYLEGGCRIGAFSYLVDSFLYGTRVGRYCSIGRACEIGQHDHPTTWLSTHPFQYSDAIGFAEPGFAFAHLTAGAKADERRWRQFMADVGYRHHTRIGHDVWIGARVFVKKGVTIGNGAVIGAGSVVTRDVPPYAIAVGSPARVLRYRFDEATREQVEALQWWRYAPWSLNAVPWHRPSKAIRLLQRWQRTGELVPYGAHGG